MPSDAEESDSSFDCQEVNDLKPVKFKRSMTIRMEKQVYFAAPHCQNLIGKVSSKATGLLAPSGMINQLDAESLFLLINVYSAQNLI
uniref:Uncharacterized protein n=1 Tax=Romanomermis culicivorax TaxID=13658 RepID=A0A915KN77_ROMCU